MAAAALLAIALIGYVQSRQAVGPIAAAKPLLSAALPSDSGGESASSTSQRSPAPAEPSRKPADTATGNPPENSTGKPNGKSTSNPTVTPGNGPGGTPIPTPISAITRPTPPPIPSSQNLCGAPPNPWGYNFCEGSHFHKAPSNFCSYFICSSVFWTKAGGYVVECADSQYSHSGEGAKGCEGHGGPWRPLLAPEAPD